ncbi:MAG: hypothetical protein JSW35_05995, partial [Deltaproteobacteria bacterium]
IRRFIKRVGTEHIGELMKLREADDLAHGWGRIGEDQIKEFKNRINAQIKKSHPFTISDLAVNGNDVMNVLGIESGPRVGKILDKLLDIVIEKPEHNQKDKLTEMLKDLKAR